MSPYLLHLHTDLEAAILTRWRQHPPHYYEMGVPDPWLSPPAGYDGPPPGFGRGDDEATESDLESDDHWLFEETEDGPLPGPPAESLEVLEKMKFDEIIKEVEQYVERPPSVTMFDHFGLAPEAFPPADRLTDEQLGALVRTIRRLWAAFNFTAVVPDAAPARVVYPLLWQRMGEPSMVATHGHIGIEFCDYEPAECPFGLEWCDCKSF